MKENSKFYSSLGLLIVLNAVIKPLWIFGIDRQVQNTIGSPAYGIYFSLLNLSIVLGFLLDLGFTSFINRQLAAKDETVKNNTAVFLLLKAGLTILYLALLYVIALLAGIERIDILLYAGLIQAATSFFVFLRTIITANQWFAVDAWLSVLDKTTMILLCGSFLYLPVLAGTMTINQFLLFQLCCTLFAVLVAIGILYKKRVALFSSKGNMAWLPVVKKVAPFALIILLMSTHNRLDGFLLERIRPDGPHEAGIYAASFRLLDASNMICYLFSSFLLPFIARLWSEQKDIETAILSGRHFLLSYSITIAAICFFMAPWLQQILYHHTDARSAEVLQWCMPALLGYALTSIYGAILTATGKIVAFNYITLFAVTLNIGLNLVLIPSLGAKGCCIAALISQSLAGIAAMLYVSRGLKNNIHSRSWFIYIFTALVLCCFLYVCRNWSGKFFVMMVAAMITAGIVIATRLVDIRQWKSLLKKR